MNDKDDQQWMDALAGKPDAGADPITNAQAHALRTTMMARRAALEHATTSADPAEFERLQARLLREGVLSKTDEATKQMQTHWLGALLGKWLQSGKGGTSAMPAWSLAANVVLGVVVVVQMGFLGTPPNSDADVLRGGLTTVQLHPNPEARLGELTSGLDLAKAHYVVQRKASGEFHLTVQAEEPALDYLLSQQLVPKVSEGIVVIVLRQP